MVSFLQRMAVKCQKVRKTTLIQPLSPINTVRTLVDSIFATVQLLELNLLNLLKKASEMLSVIFSFPGLTLTDL
jgi:hypothetical protein